MIENSLREQAKKAESRSHRRKLTAIGRAEKYRKLMKEKDEYLQDVRYF